MSLSQNDPIDGILSETWDRNLVHDLANELAAFGSEHSPGIDELRRFIAVKAFRELVDRLRMACEGKSRQAALKAAAFEMRSYALERPALSAATLRAPNTASLEWRLGYNRLQNFIASLFAEYGLNSRAANQASYILQSLVRGFVVHQLMNSFYIATSYDDSYEVAIDMFIEGLQTIKRSTPAEAHRPISLATTLTLHAGSPAPRCGLDATEGRCEPLNVKR